mgnify:CR=1 FL=1
MLKKALNVWMDSRPRLAYHREKWLWLWEKVVTHRPEKNCRKRGNTALFEQLPEGKTLFKSNGHGLAIGNLSSQILANFYFSDFDKNIERYCKTNKILYARYMDDMIFTGKKEQLLALINVVKEELLNLNLTLSDNKIHIQKAYQSFSSIGRTYCRGRTYISNRTVYNAFRAIRSGNKLIQKQSSFERNDAITRYVSRINSYFGFMKGCKTYAIKWNMWREVSEIIGNYVWCKNMRVIYVKKKHIEKET